MENTQSNIAQAGQAVENQESYTVPELVELLGLSVGKIHRLFEENILLAVRENGVLRVPKAFVLDGQPVPALRGTAIVLLDAGLSIEEAVAWLLADNEDLGEAPIALLRKNQKAPVRRSAAMLAV